MQEMRRRIQVEVAVVEVAAAVAIKRRTIGPAQQVAVEIAISASAQNVKNAANRVPNRLMVAATSKRRSRASFIFRLRSTKTICLRKEFRPE